MSRRRRQREKTWEEQRDEAQLEVERAESALQYRKSQLAEAQSELESLGGVGGFFAALVGKKAGYEAEAKARIEAANREILAARKRLIEARQALGKFERTAADREAQLRQRDEELERFAERVRSGGTHPLKERLDALEERIQTNADQLFAYDEAIYACAGLNGAIGQVMSLTGQAKAWSSMDTFRMDMPFTSGLTFLKTQEVRREAANLPESVKRFNAACARLGMQPLDIEVPDLGEGWDQLFFDNILTDLHHLRRLETFGRRLEDERELVRETMLFVGSKRKGLVEEQENLIKERRKLLDEALG